MSKPRTTAEQKRIDRRRFLTTFAMGAGAVPLFSLSRNLLAGSSAPVAPSLCYSNKRQLTPQDLQYLGAMRVPASGVDMSFSYGTLTGRKVNGAVRLLMSGSQVKGDPVYEFADTGSYHPDPAQAPRMSLVRSWGDIYGNARKTWNTSGVEKTGYPRYPGSFHWNESTQLLYWTYFDVYNVAGDEDWCLGASSLQTGGATAYGPWRPSGGGRRGPWRCIRLGEHPVTGNMLCGSILMSGNIRSPWGPDMWTGQFPNAGTPSGFGAPDLPVQKYLTYYPVYGSVNPDGSFNGPLKTMRRPGDYVFEPIAGGGFTEIDPTKNGGVGSWTSLDSVSSMNWIDLPDLQGVLFTGRLAAGHVWYRNTGVGNGVCTHGMPSPIDITGPVSTDGYPAFFIYNPADLDAVKAGQRVDYTVDPLHVVNAQSLYGTRTAPITELGAAKTFGGTYFDAAARKLYVCAPAGDPTIGGLLNPLIHVFHIA